MPDIEARLARLEAEADIRRLMARYMALCDEPATREPGPDFADLFTADLVWESASGEFPPIEGRDTLLAWFATMRRPGAFHHALNIHFLTSESVTVDGGEGTGAWLLLQPAVMREGAGELRMARLRIGFRQEGGAWRIARFVSECLLKLDAPADTVGALMAMARP
ncbi:MAG: nuclear transport factor 2 family protein [Sphingomonadales bacterium]